MRIRDVLKSKATQDVVTVGPEATVRDVVALLVRHNIGALVVSGDGTAVDGIVSERDIVRRLHTDEALLAEPVTAIMTTDVKTCDPSSGVEQLMQLMTEHRVRHVPVVTDGQLTGVVSIGDVVKSRMAELEFERDQLDHYVHQT